MNRNDLGTPIWKSVVVTRHLPDELSGLERLCWNLWWCWNDNAKAIFKRIDSELWHNSGHNPMEILDKVSLKRYLALAKDAEFVASLNKVMEEFDAYMAKKEERTDPSVGYFCMEYGIDTSLKIYSGGLGILAGDYLKESSDMNVNLVAVGLFYRYGYFTQRLTAQGNQVAEYQAQSFMRTPALPVQDENGAWKTIKVALPGRDMHARIWKVAVGRTDLYLLDTDYEDNIPEDRQVTHQLYGGDWENRLKQELLLGIGGVRALRAVGLNPTIYHYNEGHAAFAGLERLRECIREQHYSFEESMELIRASGLFTTHTPVPAGHDAFTEDLLGKYLGNYPRSIGIDWRTLMTLGKVNPDNHDEKFSMSVLAANMSQNVNGVSMLHGQVSQEIFSDMYPGYLPEELYISYVTNGVHYPTWTARDWKPLQAKAFGEDFKTHHYDKKCFEGIYNVPDKDVWEVRKTLKTELLKALNERLADPESSAHYTPRQIVTISERLRPDVLTIGFARRFATYKRATLLCSDRDRLAAIVNNPKRPVQFIFAGKAHPADAAGQELIKQIVEISKQDRFLGKIVFVSGYDITLAKRLVQGVDVWLNNPARPQEASGTSGEKAAMNGVMHFSVLDGWWVEGYRPDAGWALPLEKTYDDPGYQNELDAATIYATLENEITEVYYDVDKKNGLSTRWVDYIKNTIAKVACNFTTNRMLTDYCNQYYLPQAKRFGELTADDAKLAREITAWKQKVSAEWNNIRIISYTQPETSYVLSPNSPLKCEVVLDLGRLSPEDIGVEIVFSTTDRHGKVHLKDVAKLEMTGCEDNKARYYTEIVPEQTGMYQVGLRYFPTNSLLPHRQDFPLVKWL